MEKMSDMCVVGFGFPFIGEIYLRKIVCRSLLVSLKIDAILREVTFRRGGKKFE